MKNNNKTLRQGLGIGIIFGFLLHKGGVTKYDVIVGQLRLTDHTVIKIIFSAIIVTMLGISYFYPKGLLPVEVKSGSIKNACIGGLLFGVGFGLLGYCPGTIAGAIGSGSLDALSGGLVGIILGTILFAKIYSTLVDKNILTQDKYSGYSVFHKVKSNPFKVTIPISIIILIILFALEHFSL